METSYYLVTKLVLLGIILLVTTQCGSMLYLRYMLGREEVSRDSLPFILCSLSQSVAWGQMLLLLLRTLDLIGDGAVPHALQAVATACLFVLTPFAYLFHEAVGGGHWGFAGFAGRAVEAATVFVLVALLTHGFASVLAELLTPEHDLYAAAYGSDAAAAEAAAAESAAAAASWWQWFWSSSPQVPASEVPPPPNPAHALLQSVLAHAGVCALLVTVPRGALYFVRGAVRPRPCAAPRGRAPHEIQSPRGRRGGVGMPTSDLLADDAPGCAPAADAPRIFTREIVHSYHGGDGVDGPDAPRHGGGSQVDGGHPRGERGGGGGGGGSYANGMGGAAGGGGRERNCSEPVRRRRVSDPHDIMLSKVSCLAREDVEGEEEGGASEEDWEEEPLPTGGREVGSRSHRHRPGLVQPTVGGGGGGGGNGGNVGGGFPSVWPLGASDTKRSSSPFGSTAASSTLSNGAPHAELAAASAGLSVKRMRASPYGGRIGGGGGGAAGGAGGGADAAADWSLLAQPLPTRRSAALAALRSSPRRALQLAAVLLWARLLVAAAWALVAHGAAVVYPPVAPPPPPAASAFFGTIAWMFGWSEAVGMAVAADGSASLGDLTDPMAAAMGGEGSSPPSAASSLLGGGVGSGGLAAGSFTAGDAGESGTASWLLSHLIVSAALGHHLACRYRLLDTRAYRVPALQTALLQTATLQLQAAALPVYAHALGMVPRRLAAAYTTLPLCDTPLHAAALAASLLAANALGLALYVRSGSPAPDRYRDD